MNANKDEHAELFWALKGGASNFGRWFSVSQACANTPNQPGVITAFTLLTYPIHQVWGGFISYPIEELPAVMDALLEYQSTPDKDPYANLELLASPTNQTVGILLTLVYLKPEIRPKIFAPFYQINNATETTGLQTLTAFIASNPLPNMTTR